MKIVLTRVRLFLAITLMFVSAFSIIGWLTGAAALSAWVGLRIDFAEVQSTTERTYAYKALGLTLPLIAGWLWRFPDTRLFELGGAGFWGNLSDFIEDNKNHYFTRLVFSLFGTAVATILLVLAGPIIRKLI